MRQLVGNLLDMLQVIYSYCEATRLDEEKEAFTVHQYNKQATSIFKSFYSNLCFLKYSLQMDPAKKIPEGKFGKCPILDPFAVKASTNTQKKQKFYHNSSFPLVMDLC